MASAERRILTYHVVPRFDIAARGGPLSLGTIVADLKTLRPLNRGNAYVKIPKHLNYAPVTQTDFKDTLMKAREGNLAAWAKALGLPIGGSASIGGARELEETVSCDSIVTSYFDPDPVGEYINKSLAVKPIQDWLENSKAYTSNFYMITGLKVAKNLKFNQSSHSQRNAKAEVKAQEPQTDAVEVGVSARAAEDKSHELEFGVDDIVVGYRVNGIRCVRKWLSKDRKTEDKGTLPGNMMEGETESSEVSESSFEFVEVAGEAGAQEEAVASGQPECWVMSTV